MKNQTLEIEIPEGFMIDTFDQALGKIKLKEKPKNVMERFKTVDDVLAECGYTLTTFGDLCAGIPDDEIAYRIVKMIVHCLNEGWIPDWSNSSQYKYFPWFEMNGSSGFRFRVYDGWGSGSVVGSRLCFKSRELAEYAGKQFTSVYKQFMVIE